MTSLVIRITITSLANIKIMSLNQRKLWNKYLKICIKNQLGQFTMICVKFYMTLSMINLSQWEISHENNNP